jgi:hypothetical protein
MENIPLNRKRSKILGAKINCETASGNLQKTKHVHGCPGIYSGCCMAGATILRLMRRIYIAGNLK